MMHPIVSVPRRSSLLTARGAIGWTLSMLLAAGAARGDGGPSAAMMAPVHRLVAFMSTLPAKEHPAVFAGSGPCIVENFAPYLFCGQDAAGRWEKGFRAHEAGDSETGLTATFGAAQDFSVDQDRAYFSLPTTWTGRTHEHRFEEHGAWGFVLERAADEWRIKAYGWAVTSYAEGD